MLLEATFTDSHKNDTRDPETKLIDGLLEKQNRENKEPTSQFYGLVYSQEISQEVSKSFTWGLIADSQGFLIPDIFNPDYSLPNYLPFWFSSATFNTSDLDFQRLENIRLNCSINWFRRSNVVSFGSSFSFDLYCQIVEATNINPELVQINDYIPVMQIKVGTVTYNSANNTFSNIRTKLNFDLSDTTFNQDFINNPTEITQTTYDRIKAGASNLIVYFGFQNSTLTVAQLQFLDNRPFENTSQIQLLYKGLSKI